MSNKLSSVQKAEKSIRNAMARDSKFQNKNRPSGNEFTWGSNFSENTEINPLPKHDDSHDHVDYTEVIESEPETSEKVDTEIFVKDTIITLPVNFGSPNFPAYDVVTKLYTEMIISYKYWQGLSLLARYANSDIKDTNKRTIAANGTFKAGKTWIIAGRNNTYSLLRKLGYSWDSKQEKWTYNS